MNVLLLVNLSLIVLKADIALTMPLLESVVASTLCFLYIKLFRHTFPPIILKDPTLRFDKFISYGKPSIHRTDHDTNNLDNLYPT